MGDTLPAPRIHNLPAREDASTRTGLVGIRINDAAPFGTALAAFGVPASEIENWRIYTDSEPHTEKPLANTSTVLFDPLQIDRMLSYESIEGTAIQKRWRLINDYFPRVAPSIILGSMANQVTAIEFAGRGFVYRHGKKLACTTGIICGVGGSILTHIGVPELGPATLSAEALPLIMGGYAAFGNYVASNVGTQRKDRVMREQPELIINIAHAITPLFAFKSTAVAVEQ